jgi:hypothetical protein
LLKKPVLSAVEHLPKNKTKSEIFPTARRKLSISSWHAKLTPNLLQALPSQYPRIQRHDVTQARARSASSSVSIMVDLDLDLSPCGGGSFLLALASHGLAGCGCDKSISRDPRVRRLPRYGRDLAKQRIKVEHVRPRRPLHRVRDELRRLQRRIDRFVGHPTRQSKGQKDAQMLFITYRAAPLHISTVIPREPPRATQAIVEAPAVCAAHIIALLPGLCAGDFNGFPHQVES